VAVGTTFRWKAGPSMITSTIVDVDPPRSISWTGRMPGIHAEHHWQLTDANGQTLVRTEETWRGIVPALFRRRSQRILGDALRDVVVALKNRVAARNI
jgi:hypothetical protein